jgi:ABC-type Fe3+ transport system permease subunit
MKSYAIIAGIVVAHAFVTAPHVTPTAEQTPRTEPEYLPDMARVRNELDDFD